MRFYLSQSLFSSFDIDQGSQLLLKTIAQHHDPRTWNSLVDVGCGVGILGLAIKKKFPHIRLLGLDRDALALSFSQVNALLNKIDSGVEFQGSLGLMDVQTDSLTGAWDCLISNLPAKAGAPVLEKLTSDMLRAHSASGLVAVVIVKPLAEFMEQLLNRLQAVILYKEETREYCVFHFKRSTAEVDSSVHAISKPDDDAGDEELTPYLRTKKEFTVSAKRKTLSYTLDTAYNLSDFDNLSYQLILTMDLLADFSIKGNGLFWNPGQGHLPAFLNARQGSQLNHFFLASRDKLQLKMSRLNLLKKNIMPDKITTRHLPFFTHLGRRNELIPSPFDYVIFFPDDDPVRTWASDLYTTFSQIIVSQGLFVIVASSSVAFHLQQKQNSFTLIRDEKLHGYRGLVLKSLL